MNKIRFMKILAMLLISGILLSFMPIEKLSASASPSLSISGNSEVGGTITAVVTISGPEGTYESFSGGFSYDATLLRLDSITQGGFSSGTWDASVANSWFTAYNATIPSGTRVVSASFTCLAAGSATISLVDFEVDNIDSSASASVNIVQPVPKSSENNLSSLQVSPGTLSPSFSAGKTSYSMTVEETVSKITVSAVPADTKATISLNGVQNNLKPGDNTVKITVKAENGATKVYSILVTRAQGPTPSPTPSPVPLPLMAYRDQEFVILNFDDETTIMEGFSLTTAKYKGVDIPVIKTVLPNQTILLLVSLLTDEGQRYFIYDEVNSSVMPYIYYTQAERSLVFISPDASTPIPKGYEAFDFEYESQIITAYRLISDPQSPQILVFLMGEDGVGSYFYYDSEQKLILPYRGEVMILLPTPTMEPTPVPTTVLPTQSQTEAPTESISDTNPLSLAAMLSDFGNPLTLLFYTACLFVLLLIAAIIILLIKSRMSGVEEEEVNFEGYDTMSSDPENELYSYPYDEQDSGEVMNQKTSIIPPVIFGDNLGINEKISEHDHPSSNHNSVDKEEYVNPVMIRHNPSVRPVNLDSLSLLDNQVVGAPQTSAPLTSDPVQKPIPVRLRMEMMEESKAEVLNETAAIDIDEIRLNRSELHFPNDSEIRKEDSVEPLKFDPDL
ncbi:MAG: hypothetical protein GXY06_01655 [Clostridiaceae bacterium]|nr:hypothetical protein [Clostridiaceae bacterium]